MIEHSEFWNKRKVLITGINGFIGSHLARELVAHGAVVEGTSRNPNKTVYLDAFFPKKNIRVHPIDLRDVSSVSAVVESGSYDLIFHLASQSDTWNSIQIPQETFETNVNGTLYVLESLRRLKKSTPIVIAGSVRAFEPLNTSKVDVMAPLHPYDASKFCMQVMALSYFNAYKLPGAIAQNTNVYGPNDRNFNRLIPRMMKALCTEHTVALKGDGSIQRDFLYVNDAVSGMLRIAERLSLPSVNGKSFTFASGELHSIKEITKGVVSSFSDDVEVTFDGKPFEDRDHPHLDTRETQRVLNWKPVYSLESGLRETTSWYENYFKTISTQGGMKK